MELGPSENIFVKRMRYIYFPYTLKFGVVHSYEFFDECGRCFVNPPHVPISDAVQCRLRLNCVNLSGQ